MKDWLDYLHRIRQAEIAGVFGNCPRRAFSVGLEVGAGDGYQSALLAEYVDRLIASDWDIRGMRKRQSERIEVCECDAEDVGRRFRGMRFDLVFSSNVLEHLPDPRAALRGMHELLTDDGLMVHILPNPFWKLCDFALFWPMMMARAWRRICRNRAPALLERETEITPANNPKVRARARRGWRKLWPGPHGAYRGHLEELLAFRKRRWERDFELAGFRVICVIKGPVCSGAGLGWDGLRLVLEQSGLASEYAYVAVKGGRTSRYEAYFCTARGESR